MKEEQEIRERLSYAKQKTIEYQNSKGKRINDQRSYELGFHNGFIKALELVLGKEE